MKFTKIPETTFKELQFNVGILVRNFDPDTATFSKSDIIGATSGGLHFSAVPTFVDLGADIDNCLKNTKEFKDVGAWEITMSGTFKTATPESVKQTLAAADVSGTKITPRNHLEDEDFTEMWWIGDYSDQNNETNGGYMAVHMLNTLSTGGLDIQSGDGENSDFAFEFTAHYSITDPDTVPFEVYVKAGTAA